MAYEIQPVVANAESTDPRYTEVIAAAMRSGAELTIERTVINVRPGGVGAVREYAPAPAVVPAVPAPGREVTVTPVDDPLLEPDRSERVVWAIRAGIAACVIVGLLVAVLFVAWVIAGLSALATWIGGLIPYAVIALIALAVLALGGAVATGKCPGIHCPGPH